MTTNLTQTSKELFELQESLKKHLEESTKTEKHLRNEIKLRKDVLAFSAEGLDVSKISLAEDVIEVSGSYKKAGDDRKSVIDDAIKQLSTGKAKNHYHDLRTCYFGTKNYSSWHGQRSDHEYGYGPRHGSIIFKVGLSKPARDNFSNLTEEHIEAAIYLLVNIERVQEISLDKS